MAAGANKPAFIEAPAMAIDRLVLEGDELVQQFIKTVESIGAKAIVGGPRHFQQLTRPAIGSPDSQHIKLDHSRGPVVERVAARAMPGDFQHLKIEPFNENMGGFFQEKIGGYGLNLPVKTQPDEVIPFGEHWNARPW